MIKKIAILSTLVSTLLYGEIKDRGIFIGVDMARANGEVFYTNKGAIPTSPYSTKQEQNIPSLKLGYQYYFTRIYGRINETKTYSDNVKDYFEVKTRLVELNVDYIPMLYQDDKKAVAIRGIIGAGVGINSSSLLSYHYFMDAPVSIMNTKTQRSMEYGYNLGLIAEFNVGINFEIGYRFRSGVLDTFADVEEGTASFVTAFELETKEVYLGLNYLF